jgi:nucleotide-binding universal stress UspA family protein
MNRLLIAADGSPAADAAVQAGVQLAAEQKGGVVFLHVVEAIDVVAPAFGPIVVHPTEQGNPEDDEILSAAADVARTHGVPFELKLVAGFDYETILATADEIEAELIVIGSNRHGALGTTFFGSVSKELLKRARRPVLVVHPTAALVAATA